jgi:hypothetical protein
MPKPLYLVMPVVMVTHMYHQKENSLCRQILHFTVRKGGTTTASNVSTAVCCGMKSLLR